MTMEKPSPTTSVEVKKKPSKRVFVKAHCVRCDMEVGCWSAALPNTSPSTPTSGSGVSLTAEENGGGDNLFPAKFKSTWLGPEYPLILPDFDKAKRFLTKANEFSLMDKQDDWGNQMHVTSALICPCCGFLLACSPVSKYIDLKERLCVYRSSLKLKPVDMSAMTDENPIESQPFPPRHMELLIVNKQDILPSVIKNSIDAFEFPPLTIMMIGQFWCPYCVHAAKLLSDFCQRQNEDKSTPHLATVLLLDTFASGGASPNVIPLDIQEIVRKLPVPSYLVWFRGHLVKVEEASQHFHAQHGAIVGLDLARYIDITLPRVLSECRAARDLMGNGIQKGSLTIKL